jgi:hypothetical protein
LKLLTGSRVVTRLCLLAGIALTIAVAAGSAQAAPTVTAFPIASVIAEVKSELAAAQNTTGANLGISLQKVELNFSITRTTDANGKVTIGVPVLASAEIGGSGEHKNEQTSSVLIDLTPPGGGSAMSGQDLKDLGLTQAIVSTRAQLLQGLDQPPKLIPDKVVITLKFAITNNGGPTGQIKFLVFTLGGGVTATSANSNSIELTFGKAKPLT